MKIRIFLVIIFCIVFTEIGMRIGGAFLTKYRPSHSKVVDEKKDAVHIMFIGDSWTRGCDAPEGEGYVDVFLRKMRVAFPNQAIVGFNYAYGSTNSSQGLYQFLDHYREIRPDFLIALMGINNCWNTQDVGLAKKRVGSILDQNVDGSSSIVGLISNNIRKLKVVKFFNILLYNLIYSWKEQREPHPPSTPYSIKFFSIFTKDASKGREYLVSNYDLAENYNQFFRLILYTFGNNYEQTKNYLKGVGLWKPHLITYKFNARLQDKYTKRANEILSDNLIAIQKLCNQEGIKFIVQTYPRRSLWAEEVNCAIRDVSERYRISCVDHYRYFEKNFDIDKWNRLSTRSHLNKEGHRYMSENLFQFFMGNNYFLKLVKEKEK